VTALPVLRIVLALTIPALLVFVAVRVTRHPEVTREGRILMVTMAIVVGLGAGIILAASLR